MTTIESFRLMPDASGAPAVVNVDGYVYAFDFLGEVKCNLIKPSWGSRTSSAVAAKRARAAYERELDRRVWELSSPQAWFAANSDMYTETGYRDTEA